MVLLKSVQMNVYKLTTQQNNLAVSEFHSFIRQNDVSHLEVTVRSVVSSLISNQEQECPRRPSALQTEDTIWNKCGMDFWTVD